MTIIYLVRHGENDLIGKNHRLAGWMPDVHLNERGLAQANALAHYFSKIRLRGIYSSPLERTLETAEPIAKAKGLPIEKREGLGEIGYGRWEGQTLKSISRRKLWPVIQFTPSLARFPDGESFVEAQDRVVSEIEAIRSIHKSPKANVLCVSHADVIKLIIAHYLGLPLDLFQRIMVMPASISILQIDRIPRLVTLNDMRASAFQHGAEGSSS
jgi:probable phosphomutase (TIGR03848 family)